MDDSWLVMGDLGGEKQKGRREILAQTMFDEARAQLIVDSVQ